jgi:hypothetical protein
VLDAGGALIGIAGTARDFGDMRAIMNHHGGIGEHDDEIGPGMAVPAGCGTGGKIPTGDSHHGVIALNGGYCGNGASECHAEVVREIWLR